MFYIILKLYINIQLNKKGNYMEFNIEIIGIVAGLITTLASVPQVVQIYKTNEVSGLSLYYFIILFSGIFLWFLYGILLNSITLVVPNLITGILISLIIYKIIVLKRKKVDLNQS
jgi:MtN3 and saliva related transmembrane protein